MLKVLLGATQRDRLLGQLRRQRGQDMMGVAPEGEIVVDLVGDDDEVALDGDPPQGLELLPRPDAPDRVVGAAEDGVRAGASILVRRSSRSMA